MYDFIRGPLMWAALVIFVGGLIFRIIQMFQLSKKKERIFFTSTSSGEEQRGGDYSPEERKLRWLVSFSNSIMGNYPILTIITTIFHICLFITPVFLLGHNLFLYESWKIKFFSLPESLTDIMTIIFLLCAIFFILRRIIVPRLRAISSFNDFLLLFITIAPFLTGYLAYHQCFFNYKTMLTLHILAGEIMLMAITFTKLGHIIFFFFTRFHISSEYSLIPGSRVW